MVPVPETAPTGTAALSASGPAIMAVASAAKRRGLVRDMTWFLATRWARASPSTGIGREARGTASDVLGRAPRREEQARAGRSVCGAVRAKRRGAAATWRS
ncbi:hypothetical protein GCM10010245_20900 [Streptomyces spectabilis]|nr:hypothetical protein GCM10010245_20900 [Streptomyces spectabilis]